MGGMVGNTKKRGYSFDITTSDWKPHITSTKLRCSALGPHALL